MERKQTSSMSLQVLNAVVNRAMLARQMGQQSYGGARDITEALGYLQNIKYIDYYSRYVRQDIAKAIIDRPVDATWNGPLELDEASASETPLEEAWKELEEKHSLKNKFSRIDKLTGIGCYGVLLLGLDDVPDAEGFAKPVSSGKKQLRYVKPFSENSAQISEFEINPNNPRFGLPTYYQITITESSKGSASSITAVNSITVRVHYSRVLHIVDDIIESEIYGTPRLEVVFNRLMDLEKIIGGDAEMFWRGARPGYAGKLDKDVQATTEFQEDLKKQVDEFEHNLRRLLVIEGVELKELAQQIADPSKHVEVSIQMISAVTGIPKRILMGSERGELSSAQDSDEWSKLIFGRRGDHAEPHIVRKFVDRMIELQILPKPEKKYTIKWADLFALSEADRVKTGLLRATAIRDYSANPMSEAYFPIEGFWKYCLGLTNDQIEIVQQMIGSPMQKELEATIMEREAATAELAKPDNIPGVPTPKKTPMKRTETTGRK